MKGSRMPLGLIATIGSAASASLLPLLLTIIVIPHHVTIALPEGTFPVAKRMNIETCLVRFDVHPNTIIRTEESRSMGACFLDDADLNTREQCLRLCCETENCDVFVFEEKSPGTCFLFQCGPPENFRCKFTHHSNYTSAVLSIPPPMEHPPPPLAPPLSTQIQSLSVPQQANNGKKRLSQHEMELVSLKQSGATGANSKQQAAAAGTNFAWTSTTLLPLLGVQLGGETPVTVGAPTPKQEAPVQQCGHFEFPCHSGECIAVYNVCDGIPQCEDGSDEGVDCPQKNMGPVVPGGSLGQPPLIMMPAGSPGHNDIGNHQPMGGRVSTKMQLPMYQPLDFQQIPNGSGIGSEQQQQQQQQNQQQQQQQFGKPFIMHRNREDPMTAPKPWPRTGINDPNYVDNPDNRIFNHKGGLQLSAVNNMVPLPSQLYQESFPESSYMPSSSVLRAGGGGGAGQSYLSLSGSSSYPQQVPPQMSIDQQQSQYKAVSPLQWTRGNSMRSSWPLQSSTSDQLQGFAIGPQREQYIQPPVQQRRPTVVMQGMEPFVDLASDSRVASSSSSQQKSSSAQTQLSTNGLQWPLGNQSHQVSASGPTPTRSTTSTGESVSSRTESLTKVVASGPAGQVSVPGAGENQNGAKHKSGAALEDSRDAGAEYEEDAYEDSYPDSTNAAGSAAAGPNAEEPTQTEVPKKKLRKHHKHEHGDTGNDTNPSTSNEQADEKKKRKKKPKTIKKDKAMDHHHAPPSDSAVHEHLKAELHKDLEIEFTDHDGFADRPGGAMLSLTLGVLLTAVMGILLSCRMRVARRRIRRPGKSSYAHDADFLVNGMYL